MITLEEIRQWLLSAKDRGASHMLVIWDSFDVDDGSSDSHFPVDVMPDEDLPAKMAEYAPEHVLFHPNMNVLIEVYDLKLDLEEQLNERRAMHFAQS